MVLAENIAKDSVAKAVVVVCFLALSYYISGPFGAVAYTCGLLIGRYLKSNADDREKA